MKKRIQILPSGLSLIDKSWGGLYNGGTYLLIGPRKSGKTIMGLQYAMECARQKEICLFFTSMKPKDLMILAASIDFDLQEYMNQNLIILIRVAPPKDPSKPSINDNFYAEYLKDIITVVEKYKPAKIVFDELTPFLNFNSMNLLKHSFLKTTEAIEESAITSLFILGEPATPAARKIVDTLSEFSTGVILLLKDEIGDHSGTISIIPTIGHNEGKFSAKYFIEPYKGIVDDFKQSPHSGRKTEFRSLLEIEAPDEEIYYPNLYSINDFELILNNQIALYKSTGQVFTLVTFRLEPESSGIINSSLLYNAVRLSLDRKDKLCRIENLHLVLIQGDDPKSVTSVISKVKKNLLGDREYSDDILKAVTVNITKVDSSVTGSEDLLKRVYPGESKEKSKFGYY